MLSDLYLNFVGQWACVQFVKEYPSSETLLMLRTKNYLRTLLCMYHPLCSYSTFVTHSKAIHTLNPDVDKYLQIKIALTLF